MIEIGAFEIDERERSRKWIVGPTRWAKGTVEVQSFVTAYVDAGPTDYGGRWRSEHASRDTGLS